MLPFEIILAIKSYCDDDLKETVEETNDLIGQILNNPRKFAYDLSIELEEFCDIQDICTNCGNQITYETYKEDRGEYLGTPCSENITYTKCPNCGLIE